MLRTLARTTVILVLAAAVAGALYLAIGSHGGRNPGQAFPQGDPESFDGHRGGGHDRWDGPPADRGPHHGRQEASVGRGIAGVGGTALQLGCVGAVVVWLQRRSRRQQHAR